MAGHEGEEHLPTGRTALLIPSLQSDQTPAGLVFDEFGMPQDSAQHRLVGVYLKHGDVTEKWFLQSRRP